MVVLVASPLGLGCGDETPFAPDFPPLPTPPDNPQTPEKVALGRRLFFDPLLSRNRDVACGSCHLQRHAFADPRRLSEGTLGRLGTRNAPGLFNLAYTPSYFWDGGVDTLERQAIAPIKDEREMDLPFAEAVARVAASPLYPPLFAAAFGRAPDGDTLTKALASFVRSLVSGGSAWDHHRRGKAGALSAAATRGAALFFGERGGCAHCHDGPFFTNHRFANNGTYIEGGDVGRQRVTQRSFDLGHFRVPSLRNVAVTAPYMHDGSLATLADVIDHYDRGGGGHPSTDPSLRPLHLSQGEKDDLVAFLEALTDEPFLIDPRHKNPHAPAPGE